MQWVNEDKQAKRNSQGRTPWMAMNLHKAAYLQSSQDPAVIAVAATTCIPSCMSCKKSKRRKQKMVWMQPSQKLFYCDCMKMGCGTVPRHGHRWFCQTCNTDINFDCAGDGSEEYKALGEKQWPNITRTSLTQRVEKKVNPGDKYGTMRVGTDYEIRDLIQWQRENASKKNWKERSEGRAWLRDAFLKRAQQGKDSRRRNAVSEDGRKLYRPLNEAEKAVMSSEHLPVDSWWHGFFKAHSDEIKTKKTVEVNVKRAKKATHGVAREHLRALQIDSMTCPEAYELKMHRRDDISYGANSVAPAEPAGQPRMPTAIPNGFGLCCVDEDIIRGPALVAVRPVLKGVVPNSAACLAGQYYTGCDVSMLNETEIFSVADMTKFFSDNSDMQEVRVTLVRRCDPNVAVLSVVTGAFQSGDPELTSMIADLRDELRALVTSQEWVQCAAASAETGHWRHGGGSWYQKPSPQLLKDINDKADEVDEALYWHQYRGRARMINHDEMPSFVNFNGSVGNARRSVACLLDDIPFDAVPPNRDSFSAHLFADANGLFPLWHLLFSQSLFSEGLVPDVFGRIATGLISLTAYGMQTQESLKASYTMLVDVLSEERTSTFTALRDGKWKVVFPIVQPIDGAASRYGEDVLEYCRTMKILQTIEPGDASGFLQMLDQARPCAAGNYIWLP
jgi:hypothetical protein